MPNMGAGIQSKGLTILEDQMHQEFLAFKKAKSYASAFENPKLKGLASSLAQQHMERYNRLFDYLNGHQ